MWLVDVHCHTAGPSPDSALSLSQALSDAARAGIDALCLTEHDAFWRPEELADQAGSNDRDGSPDAGNCRVKVIPGAEINTDCGHVLVFGLTAYRFGFHHPLDLARAVQGAGGAMILAHPYRRALPPDVMPNSTAWDAALGMALESPLLKLVDAVEVMNGRGSDTENQFAAALARAASLPGLAGSDAHQLGVAGCAVTEFYQPVRNVEDLIRALKSGSFRPAPPSTAAGQPGHEQF